ncbi:hypothetical protein OA848_01530 [Rickettsiales bacterium]|nr:hypothetical protein [Rickettsiales bacterium]
MNYKQKFYNFDDKLDAKIDLNKLKDAHLKVLDELQTDKLECLSIVNNFSQKQIIKEISKKLRRYETILFLGTGGSSLGGKTLYSLKNNQFINNNNPKIYFIENIDSEQIMDLLKCIDFKRTGFVVISKSGETIETLSQFFMIKNFSKNIVNNFSKNLYIITENKKSTLKKIQEELKCPYYEHSKLIGGRYSIFSLVGMIPAELSNLDSEKIHQGGAKVLEQMSRIKNIHEFPPALASLKNYNLIKEGINQNILMPYSDSLLNFSMWFRQLWGESIGKNGKGSTPISGMGTVDQHSQLQLYLDGPRDKFINIIYFKKKKKSIELDCYISKNFVYENLHKKNMNELLVAETMATFETLKKKNVPIRMIELESNNEETIGSILMHFFLETIYTCYLLDINPFNQPAVEEGKKLAIKYLNHGKDKTSF